MAYIIIDLDNNDDALAVADVLDAVLSLQTDNYSVRVEGI